jgi:hypothetical protein
MKEKNFSIDHKEITDYVWLAPEEALNRNDITDFPKTTIRKIVGDEKNIN